MTRGLRLTGRIVRNLLAALGAYALAVFGCFLFWMRRDLELDLSN